MSLYNYDRLSGVIPFLPLVVTNFSGGYDVRTAPTPMGFEYDEPSHNVMPLGSMVYIAGHPCMCIAEGVYVPVTGFIPDTDENEIIEDILKAVSTALELPENYMSKLIEGFANTPRWVYSVGFNRFNRCV